MIALLWPEQDQPGGRHALRNALHAIRQALGEGQIITKGDNFVGLARRQVFCDAVELEAAVEAGRDEEAVSLYQGELLQGFHVSEAPGFERWLDDERARLRSVALEAAWRGAERCRAKNDLEGAVKLARRAAAIAPDDEPTLRRVIDLLRTIGDRAGALRAYQDFADRLNQEYGAEPSTDTRNLALTLKQSNPAGLEPAYRPPPVPPMAMSDPPEGAPNHQPALESAGWKYWILGAVLLLSGLLAWLIR